MKHNRLIHLLFHIIAYYIAWFACVIYASLLDPWRGPIIVTCVSIVQVLWQYYRQDFQHMWRFIVTLTLLGFIIDSLFARLGLITFYANPWPLGLCPPWMIAIWLNFSIVVYACIRHWFKRYWLLGSLCLVGFPFAYWCGVKIGAAEFGSILWSPIIIGATWMLLFPLTTYIYSKVAL